MTLFSICIAGFAAVSALLLFFTYAAYIRVPGKSAFSVFSCAALVACLATLEIGHLLHFLGGAREVRRVDADQLTPGNGVLALCA